MTLHHITIERVLNTYSENMKLMGEFKELINSHIVNEDGDKLLARINKYLFELTGDEKYQRLVNHNPEGL